MNPRTNSAPARLARAGAFRGFACHCDPAWPLHFVHSEGLRELAALVLDWGCNVRPRQRPAVKEATLVPHAAQLRDGDIVHVKTDRLDAFVRVVLPTVRVRIVLVTGDSDASAPGAHAALLDEPRIAHWFAQNWALTAAHPKLTRIPIGLDNPVYTKLDKRLGFLITMALGRSPLDWSCNKNDIGQQGMLAAIAATLPPTAARPARALCTFHQSGKIVRLALTPDRLAAWRVLRDRPHCYFVPHRLTQPQCWRLHGEFAFQVSPPGNGLDCFRTWESLALGVIPIVKTSPLDALYRAEELPVVIVEDWDEITRDNLERWQREFQDAFDERLRHKLSLAYWAGQLRTAAALARQEPA